MNNYFGNILDQIGGWLKKNPIVSTWSIALVLSSVWTLAWLFVFFLSTWLMDMTTKAVDFVNVFWLSIAAEAAIRWAENTTFAAKLQRPYDDNAKGDNWGFRLTKAFLILLAILALLLIQFLFTDKTGLRDSSGSFMSQASEESVEDFWNMLVAWWVLFWSPYVCSLVLAGTILRAYIYKRPHIARS